jgi:hypothetical protein
LLHLTAFEDGPNIRAWKGHDWGALDRLHEKGFIANPRNKANVQETMHLLSIPGMRESIREGLETPVEELETELDW